MASTSPKPVSNTAETTATQPATQTVIPNLDLKELDSALRKKGYDDLTGFFSEVNSRLAGAIEKNLRLLVIEIEKERLGKEKYDPFIDIDRDARTIVVGGGETQIEYSLDTLMQANLNDGVTVRLYKELYDALTKLQYTLNTEVSDIAKVKALKEYQWVPKGEKLANSIVEIRDAVATATKNPSQQSTAYVGSVMEKGASLAPPATATQPSPASTQTNVPQSRTASPAAADVPASTATDVVDSKTKFNPKS